METISHCTVAPPRQGSDLFALPPLALAILWVHGYHPWAEDGGLYTAGIKYLLNPSLFSGHTEFVTEHLRFSLFAPAMAALVRFTQVPLAWVLLAVYLVSVLLTLLAAFEIARCCFSERFACWTAVGLLSAWWTLPVAGTSLLLMDPYVTARSLSTPLSLLAVRAALLRGGTSHHPSSSISFRPPQSPFLLCALSLLVASALHPLMAAYAAGLVVALRLPSFRSPRAVYALLLLLLLLCCGVWLLNLPPETLAVQAAVRSRPYWFLSEWRWYEWCGLVGPAVVFAIPLTLPGLPLQPSARVICRACLRVAGAFFALAAAFAQEHLRSHAVARLQPLRAFLPLYALMILLLGGTFGQLWLGFGPRLRLPWRLSRFATPTLASSVLLLSAFPLWLTQRATFPMSPEVEWPGQANPNGWVQGFLWAREHTPQDAVFAVDARYINLPGEDTQSFRVIAERDVIPDYSKDGGEAAITPALAPAWSAAAAATAQLSEISDARRLQLLRPLGVQWLVLQAPAVTTRPCPYRNSVIKICRLEEEHREWAHLRPPVSTSVAGAQALLVPPSTTQSRPVTPKRDGLLMDTRATLSAGRP